MLMRYLNYSGASKMFLWVAKELAATGNTVTIYVFSNDISRSPETNIQFINEDLSRKNIITRIKSVRKVIKESDADVSISFLLDANVYNTMACIGLKTKSIICERSDPYKPRYYKLKIFKPLFRFANGAVFQLKKVAEYYSNIKGTTAIIPNPVTISSNVDLKPFKQREKQIVTVGRIAIEQKRNDIQIKAFALVHKKYPDYKLVIYGNSSNNDDKKLRQLIAELKLTDHVIMPGVVDNVQEKIKDSQIYLITSDYEGIPNSLIEAMVIGLPCISTDCRPGGASLLIQNKENGLLTPCNDYQAIADKICWLIEHPLEADKMGEKAKMIADKFSESIIASMWNKYIEEVTKTNIHEQSNK